MLANFVAKHETQQGRGEQRGDARHEHHNGIGRLRYDLGLQSYQRHDQCHFAARHHSYTNLTSAYLCIQQVIGSMLKQRWGRIINVSSVFGQIGQAGQANYASSKAGLIGLTMAIAREVASRNITCNAVAPGFIETAMTAGLAEDLKQNALKVIPLGRVGTAEDVANAVAFLASDEASYITGHVLNVNGGMFMG